MPYPKHLINENENVILDLRPHWWFFARHILGGVLLAVAGIFIVGLSGTMAKVTGFGWAILLVVWACWLGIKFLDWQFTHFVVTDHRVIFRTGVLAKHGVEIPLERINNINFHQRIIDRFIGAGDLDIESAGKQGQSHFDFVRHPDAVQQEIYRQMEANAKKQAGWAAPQVVAHAPQSVPPADVPPAAPPQPPVAEQLKQLAELRDQGVITPAEFDAKKAELLQRM